MSRFDQLASKWDSKPQRVESALTFVDAIIENIKEDTTNFHALDYGCGSGLVSFGLIEHISSIDGMDNSSGMIDVYNQKLEKLELSTIQSKLHDINHQELDKEHYDLIVTNMTMHHIKDTDMFINKLSSSLKENGYLCIADLETENGTFHSCNDGVEHFGFNTKIITDLYIKNNLRNINIYTLQVINKPQQSYNIFIAIGQK